MEDILTVRPGLLLLPLRSFEQQACTTGGVLGGPELS